MKIGKIKLKLFLTSFSLIAVSAFLMVSTGYAASTVSLEGFDSVGGYYNSNYGYHSSSSGDTTNKTTRWQALGNSADIGNYGVTWTTNNASWGREDLYVGQEVKFRFEMYSANQGSHYGNVLKAWFDGNGDATFNSSDVVASGFAKVGHQTAGSSVEYISNTITITEDMIGTTYLRARVTCTESIFSTHLDNPWWRDNQWHYSQQTYINVFDAYADYWQGEIEEWAIKINGDSSGSTSPIPEPATFALFGVGLLGLSGISRRKINNQS
ncbi:MAG: PEP-CTERM sorting domain-containing protein [Desulfobacterales bacterium]|nr:PEP-CTERM sorting domain-containing protein [Desulfobacterales bacterium]